MSRTSPPQASLIRASARVPWACLILFVSGAAFSDGLLVVPPERVGLSSERLARLGAAMQAEVDSGAKAGIVALVARRGQVAYLAAYGHADLASDTAMTTEHLFRLFSMTKPVTSVALLMLYEEGEFQLTDPLSRYIPAFENIKVFAGVDDSGAMILEDPRRPPTIQDVFRHTAGFSYGLGVTPVDRAYQEAGIDFTTLTSLEELVVEKMPTLPLLYHPGERWVYSVAHDVQAYLVEYFSGMQFDEFCRARIFDPLGMDDTVFGIPHAYVSRSTSSYGSGVNGDLTMIENRKGVRAGSGANPSGGYARFTDVPFGGLGLSSTAMDYARFAQMLVEGGSLEGTRLLAPRTVELMRTNHLPEGIQEIGFMPGTGYGLGVSVRVDAVAAGNLAPEGVFGWAGAASTFVTMDPENEIVTVLLTQYMPVDDEFAARFETLVYQSIVD